MIERLGFTDYFLLVAEIVGFARARGIPSVGRGSGASSMVAYVLGITNVDPIHYGLSFERFLNPSRRDCPDLDIDLCWKRRDEVIQHVYDTYGDDRVAMISTQSTLGARSAFRETAKALGVPNARVNALARRIPRDLEAPYQDRLREAPEGRAVDWSEPVLARALALAERLAGSPRHLSVHSGGVGDRRPRAHALRAARARRQADHRHPVRDACDRGDRAREDGPAREPRPHHDRRMHRDRAAARRQDRRGGARADPTAITRRRRASRPATRSTASSSNRPRCAIWCACWMRARSTTPSRRWRWCVPGPRSRA